MTNYCNTIQLRKEWKIENFDKEIEDSQVDKCLRSEIFTHEEMPDIHCQMELYPNGNEAIYSGNLSLYLGVSTEPITEEFTLKTKYCFYFLDTTSMPRSRKEFTSDFELCPPKGSADWGWKKIISKNAVMAYIRSDKSLTVVCELEIIPHIINPTKSNTEFLQRQHHLYKSGEGSDFVIEFFHAMLTNKSTAESINGRVLLKDTTPTAIQHMLTYMYSGAFPDNFDNEEDAQSLMIIAEKYALNTLKSRCQDKLIEREKVLFNLTIADTHNGEKLITACLSIIHNNRDELINSGEWTQFENENSRLAISVLKKILGSAPILMTSDQIKELFYHQSS